MKRETKKSEPDQSDKPGPVSLAPLKTDEAIAALLAIKPVRKPAIRGKGRSRKKRSATGRADS